MQEFRCVQFVMVLGFWVWNKGIAGAPVSSPNLTIADQTRSSLYGVSLPEYSNFRIESASPARRHVTWVR